MLLCREAVLGPTFTSGSGTGNSERFRPAVRLAAFGGETDGGSEDTNHASR